MVRTTAVKPRWTQRETTPRSLLGKRAHNYILIAPAYAWMDLYKYICGTRNFRQPSRKGFKSPYRDGRKWIICVSRYLVAYYQVEELASIFVRCAASCTVSTESPHFFDNIHTPVGSPYSPIRCTLLSLIRALIRIHSTHILFNFHFYLLNKFRLGRTTCIWHIGMDCVRFRVMVANGLKLHGGLFGIHVSVCIGICLLAAVHIMDALDGVAGLLGILLLSVFSC